MTLEQLKPRLEKIRKRMQNASPEERAKWAAQKLPEETPRQKAITNQMFEDRNKGSPARYRRP